MHDPAFGEMIREIKRLAEELDPATKGVAAMVFVAKLLHLADLTSEAAEVVKNEPGFNGLYWEMLKFLADSKHSQKKGV